MPKAAGSSLDTELHTDSCSLWDSYKCTYEHWVTIYRKWLAFGFHDVQIAHVGILWRPLISRHWTVRTLQVSLSKNPGIPLLTGWRRVGKRVKLRGRASIPPGYLRTYKNLRGSGGSWNSHLNSNISKYTCRFGMHRIKAHYAPVYCRMECCSMYTEVFSLYKFCEWLVHVSWLVLLYRDWYTCVFHHAGLQVDQPSRLGENLVCSCGTLWWCNSSWSG